VAVGAKFIEGFRTLSASFRAQKCAQPFGLMNQFIVAPETLADAEVLSVAVSVTSPQSQWPKKAMLFSAAKSPLAAQ
jgi:hypothetical protein